MKSFLYYDLGGTLRVLYNRMVNVEYLDIMKYGKEIKKSFSEGLTCIQDS